MMLNVIGNEIEADSIQFCPDKRTGCGEYRQPAMRWGSYVTMTKPEGSR
jgi:hypothetical protein